jgi:thiol-disulfide isomerase/thioredoxin
MKRITFLILSFFIFSHLSFGQSRMKFDFPAWAEKSVQLYYSYGSKVDSVIIALNKTGQADVNFPDKDFHGFVQLADRGVELTEFIVGEPVLDIVCHAPVANTQTITFPGSEENIFFHTNLNLQSQLTAKLGWLQAGYQFYGYNPGVITFVQQESKHIQDSIQTLTYTIDHSPLYAARFIQWVGFLNRMYEARQQRDQAKIKAAISEMETTADINTLYTAGQLWNTASDIYFSLFNQMDDPNKQLEYAASINRTAERLSGGALESFFAAAVVQCEQYRWEQAQEIIVQQIVWAYSDMEIKSNRLQRLIGLQKARKGVQAPEIVGLKQPVDQPLLVIFYESGCGHCQAQLAVLKENYPAIRDKGFRVVSVSSDVSQEVYDYHSKDFPWPDKICDYKGLEGVNFINYGVIGTPSIYMIDKKGIIQGRFAIIADTGVLN